MFERFTQAARAIVIGARDEAQQRHHPHVGCGHLLLALTTDSGAAGEVLRARGVTQNAVRRELTEILAAIEPPARPTTQEQDRQALAMLGIDLDRVREAVERRFGPDALESVQPVAARGPRLPWRRRPGSRECAAGRIRFAPQAKKALELALREAIHRREDHIGAEHLLLGLLRDHDSVATGILARLGVRRDVLRADLDIALRRAA